MVNLCEYGLKVLITENAVQKAEKTRAFVKEWLSSAQEIGIATDVPDRPARPEKPELKPPTDMPKRGKGGSQDNKIALLHALAHIELNAIDLAWDIIARFSPLQEGDEFTLPNDFYLDWLKVADDEAKHFLLLETRLNDFYATYGDLPAHDGLWESAEKTAHDLPARLAVVPMVLEARGLDVTPGMIKNMRNQNDDVTANLLQVIHDDEITHVYAGTKWFKAWCDYHDLDQKQHWRALVAQYFTGTLKPPFNHPSREQAGLLRHWYDPLLDAA